MTSSLSSSDCARRQTCSGVKRKTISQVVPGASRRPLAARRHVGLVKHHQHGRSSWTRSQPTLLRWTSWFRDHDQDRRWHMRATPCHVHACAFVDTLTHETPSAALQHREAHRFQPDQISSAHRSGLPVEARV